MAGSGTTLVTAQMLGHQAIGFDSDPLAVLLSSAWTSKVDVDALQKKAVDVLEKAERAEPVEFPQECDKETKKFIKFWFDKRNRIQLTALANVIRGVRNNSVKVILWCAFSRMIITKKMGVSLAMDVSHSRPHKKYKKAPETPFGIFERSVSQIAKASKSNEKRAIRIPARIAQADARKLPLKSRSIDAVITSPPYLNAIDYLRGHKLALVWMGYSISAIRSLRASNIGTEVGMSSEGDKEIEKVISAMCDVSALSNRNAAMLRRYAHDTRAILSEVYRVLRPNGKAVFVVGDCNIKNVFIKNSKGIELFGKAAGMTLKQIRKRQLPENRRYLPPPGKTKAGAELQKRMREEIIITFTKPRLAA